MKRCRLVSLIALVAVTALVGCGRESTPEAPSAPSPTPAIGPPGTIHVSGANPVARATRFGQNYWCWSNYGDYVTPTVGLASELGLRVLRAGGHNNDDNTSNGFDPFDKGQIDRFVAYARSVGAEPILQVPRLKNERGGPATPEDAADMVRYCNRTRGYAIRYWAIGNEPDLYSDQGDIPGYDVTRFCDDFNARSDAMKRVDPAIQILGPELSWKYPPQTGANDWLTPFLTRCRGRFDIVSIHRYPFDAQGATIANAMADVARFDSVVRTLGALLASMGLAEVPLAITEANVSWDGDPAHSTQSASPQTFYAGLWVADSLGAAIRQRLWAICYWSLSEGWTLGFFDTAARPRPSYYASQLVALHTGPTLLTATAPAGFSAYASRSADGRATLVVVINKNDTTNRESIAIAERTETPAGSYAYDFPPYSLSVVSIPDDGTPMKVWMYTKPMADAGTPPQQLQ